jgi:hypothetical protein
VGIATVRKIETGVVVEPGYFTVMALMGVLGIPSDPLGRQDSAPGRHDGPEG